MNYKKLARTYEINNIAEKLESQLAEINDQYDNGNESPLDNLHEEFTVAINGCNISLGCMDTYDAFCSFLKVAAENNQVADNKTSFIDNTQDAHQYIERDAEVLKEVFNSNMPDEISIEVDGCSYPLPTWSCDVVQILDTACANIANFAKSQYQA